MQVGLWTVRAPRARTWCVAVGVMVTSWPVAVFGQQTPSDFQATPPPAVAEPAADTTALPARQSSGMNLLDLLVAGGWFMIPLAILSLAVVALALERALALRRKRLLPEELLEGIAAMSEQDGGLDPRGAYRLCQVHPSAASQVLRAVLAKVGRPHVELEGALHETAQRSATRLQQPVSWLSLIAAVAPLVGLLGTVWGITQAFYDTTQMEIGDNRAEALASGIYMALVTTIAGLTIAIPAAVLAHFFENQIVSHHCAIEDMVASLLPQLERFEGQVRFVDGPGGRRDGNEAMSLPHSSPRERRGTRPQPVPELRPPRPVAPTESRD